MNISDYFEVVGEYAVFRPTGRVTLRQAVRLEVIGGSAILEVKSKEEAIEWPGAS
jgi:hypothetical protein